MSAAVDASRAWFDKNPLRVWRKADRTRTLGTIGGNVGVGIAAIQNWEHGTAKPNDEHMRKLAELIGISERTLRQRWDRWMAERDK